MPVDYEENALNPQALTPVRNPGLIRRVANAIFRADPTFGPQPADKNTTQSGVVAQALQSVYDQYFRSQNDRLAIYKDVDEMDNAAEEVSVALDAIANNVCTSEDGQMESFQVLSEDARVLDVLNRTCDTANLYHKVRAWTRNTLKYGDGFAEIVINAQGEIVDVKQLPPSTMWRNVDIRGNLILGEPRFDKSSGQCLNKPRECAYEQRAEDTQTVVSAFWPFQIVHTRLNHDGFKAYGRSHLRVTRIIWKKLKAMEEAMIIARLTRAWPSNRYFVDTTGRSPSQKEQDLMAFQQSVAVRRRQDGARENPPWVGSDLFIADAYVKSGSDMKPSLTKIDTYDPKLAGLSEIADYQYLHRKLLATLRIPAAYLNFEADVNAKATLGFEDVEYVRFIRDVQQLMAHSIKQILDTALVLNGIDPEQADYTVKFPTLSANDEGAAAQSEMWRSTADAFYESKGVIDREWMQRNRFGFEDEEIEAIMEREAEEAKQQAQIAADAAEADRQRQIKLMQVQPVAMNGNGKAPSEPPPVVPSAVDGMGSKSARTIKQESELLPEIIATKALGFLRTDFERVRQAQGTVLEMARTASAEASSRITTSDGSPVSVNFAEGAIQVLNNVPAAQVTTPITVQPADVVIPPSPAPVVNVRPSTTAPVVNVTASAPAPVVNVEAAQAPNVTVMPPQVNVTVEPGPPVEELAVKRDKDGNISGILRKKG